MTVVPLRRLDASRVVIFDWLSQQHAQLMCFSKRRVCVDEHLVQSKSWRTRLAARLIITANQPTKDDRPRGHDERHDWALGASSSRQTSRQAASSRNCFPPKCGGYSFPESTLTSYDGDGSIEALQLLLRKRRGICGYPYARWPFGVFAEHKPLTRACDA